MNLNLRGVSVGRALKAILDGLSTGFYGATISYSLEDGVVAIASSMDLGRDFYTVVYDISDLLIEVTDRRGGGDYEAGGGQSQQGGGGGDRGTSSNQRSGSSRRSTSSGRSGEDAGEDREGLVERVVELITNVSPADTWQEEGTGEGTITVWGTRLVVNQTSENHTKIRDMLDQIRETRPVQISVEPRFIFVTDNVLEDIGIDLDFYLNPQGRWTGPDTRGFVVPPPIGTGFPGFRTGVPAPLVGILMGSKSDWEVMKNVTETLDALGIPSEAKALSAHRNPDQVIEYAETARDRGLKVIIAGAGMAAALPGVVAAKTSLPVLGVPMETRVMGGMDSLLSMAQMPGGIPVGTLAIGKAGAKNAALLAAAILALSDETIAKTLDDFRQDQNDTIAELD